MSADLRIDEELAICEAATQWGVLRMHTYEDGTSSNRIFEHLTGRLIADNVDGPDATFIAHARTGYPIALRRIQELEKQLAAALAERDAAIVDRDQLRRAATVALSNVQAATTYSTWPGYGVCLNAESVLRHALNHTAPLTPDTEATEQ